MMTTGVDLAILAALDEEVEAISSELVEPQVEEIGPFHVMHGRLGGCEVVVGRTGIGKVNAAVHVQSVIARFRPRAIIFTGVAGALVPGLRIGDLVFATLAIQHDYDLTAFNRAPGFVPIGGDIKSSAPELLAEATRVLGQQSVDRLQGIAYFETDANLRRLAFSAYDSVRASMEFPFAVAGPVASGDQFVADSAVRQRIQRDFGAVCVEMEGAAAAHACYLSGTPFLLIRAVSDTADGSAVESFEPLARTVAKRAAELVKEIAARIFRDKTGSVEREFKWIVPGAESVRGVTRTLAGIIGGVVRGERWERVHLTDIYFDTPDKRLARAGATLRVREDGSSIRCSVKTGANAESGLFRRVEIEWLIGEAPFKLATTFAEHLSSSDTELPALEGFAKGLSASWTELAEALVPSIVIENDRSTIGLRFGEGRGRLGVDEFSGGRPNEEPSLRSVEIELELEKDELLRDPVVAELIEGIEASFACVGSTKSKYLRTLDAINTT